MLTIILLITCIIVAIKSPSIALACFIFLAIIVTKAMSDIGSFSRNRKVSFKEVLSVIEKSKFEEPVDLNELKKIIHESVKEKTSFAYGMLAPFIFTHKLEILGGTLNKVAVYNWDKFNLFAIQVKSNGKNKALKHVPLHIGNNIIIIKTVKTFSEFKKNIK